MRRKYHKCLVKELDLGHGDWMPLGEKKKNQRISLKVFQRIKQHDRIKEAGVCAACLETDYTNLDEIKSTKR